MTTIERNDLIEKFAAWLLKSSCADSEDSARRIAWDFVAGAWDGNCDLERWQDAYLDMLADKAQDRLRDLGLSVELADDASGQTTAEEHWSWLASAKEEDIRKWVASMDAVVLDAGDLEA